MYTTKFTGEQARRIDELINSDFEGATKEDIELYTSWQIEHAKVSEEFEAIREAAARQYEESSRILKKQSDDASKAFNMFVQKAVERLERLDDGK